MGFRDKFKKKGEDKEKPEEIGALNLEETIQAERIRQAAAGTNAASPPNTALPPPVLPANKPTGGTPGKPAEGKKIDSLTSLDIFSSETAETDGEVKLWEKLPEIEIHDLLVECRDIATALKTDPAKK